MFFYTLINFYEPTKNAMTKIYVTQNIQTGEVLRHRSIYSLQQRTKISLPSLRQSLESNGAFSTTGYRVFNSPEDFEKYKDVVFMNGGYICYNVFTKEKYAGNSYEVAAELSISIPTLRALADAKEQPIHNGGFIIKRNDGIPFREIKENLIEELYVSRGTPVLRTTPGYGFALFKSLADVGRYCGTYASSKPFLRASETDTFYFNGHTFNKLKNVFRLQTRVTKNEE